MKKIFVVWHDNRTGCGADEAGNTEHVISDLEEIPQILVDYLRAGVIVYRTMLYDLEEV